MSSYYGEFKKKTIWKIVNSIIALFVFFVIFYFEFGLIMAGFMVYVIGFLLICYLYLWIKFDHFKFKILDQIENIEYIIKRLKK